MKNAKSQHRGPTKSQTREEAVKEYVMLRMRVDEFNHLDYLLLGLKHKRIALPNDSPHSTLDLANTVRTCLVGWLATLTDKDDRVIYAFNCLLHLFPKRRLDIGVVQDSLEAIHGKLQAFRSNVAFHARSDIYAHFHVRKSLQAEDAKGGLEKKIKGFKRLMEILISEELEAIPELPTVLKKMGVSHMPAFSRRKARL
jgi:hypothetical protein